VLSGLDFGNALTVAFISICAILDCQILNSRFWKVKIFDCQNSQFKSLEGQKPEFKILKGQNPEFNMDAASNHVNKQGNYIFILPSLSVA